MRKFPVYTFLQEITNQVMMLLVVLGYIVYDQMGAIGSLSCPLLAVIGLGLVYLFWHQLKSMKAARILFQIKASRFKSLKTNWTLFIVFNVVFVGLAALHFYVWSVQGKELQPLINEYGLGALLGVILIVYNAYSFMITITDKGIAIGSQMDMKLIEWFEFEGVSVSKESITLELKSSFAIQTIKLDRDKNAEVLLAMLRSNGVRAKKSRH